MRHHAGRYGETPFGFAGVYFSNCPDGAKPACGLEFQKVEALLQSNPLLCKLSRPPKCLHFVDVLQKEGCYKAHFSWLGENWSQPVAGILGEI